MAVTIQSSPDSYQPASNAIEWTFSSTNTAQDNFSFYIELSIGGSVHSYHEVFPESSNYGKFNASEIVRSYVNSSLDPDGSYQVGYSSAVTQVKIRVKDKYGSPPVPTGSYVTSNIMFAFNGSLRHQDWINFDYTDYDFTTSNAGTPIFLTDFPRAESYFCGLTESMFLSYICSDTTFQMIVKLYDVTGSTIATTTDSITPAADNFELVDVSPTSLIANTSLTSANFSTCYYYTVQGDATGGGGNPGLGEEFKIYIDTECTQYTTRRLLWLNKYGGFDAFTFTLYSEEKTQIQSNNYETSTERWESNSHNYNLYNGQRQTAQKTSTDTLKINSNWIKQDKQQWLVQSLLESPLVYLEISHNVFEPVRVRQAGFTKKQRIKEGLIQESFTLERTYTYRSQLN